MAIPLLPKLTKVLLNNFSLYSRQPDVEVEFDLDVFCLAGANGLGKSTFLALITYALTGRVPEPDRSFQSIEDYVRESRDFTREYFRGRVDALDLDIATVTATFELGDKVFEVRRGFEQPEDVLLFSMTLVSDPLTESVVQLDEDEPLNLAYERVFCETSGLRSFDQFVFLQHFVLTFDERRHLIFWEPRLTEPALFLSFGGDSDVAARASALRAAMDRQGSRARNSRWQATATRARIEALRSADALTQRDYTDAGSDRLARVRSAFERKARSEARLEAVQRQIVDGHVAFGQASSTLSETSRRLERTIASTDGRRDPWHHPMVIQMQETGKCVACGSGTFIGERLAHATTAVTCPVCGDGLTDLTLNLSPEILDLDAESEGLRNTLREAQRNLDRLQYDLSEAEGELNQAIVSLEEFALEDRIAVQRTSEHAGASLEVALAAMESEVLALSREADTYIEARDTLRRDLDMLVTEVTNAYFRAEQEFVPIFRELAESFIGLPLDVELLSNGGNPLSLGLTVDGTRRAKTSQLSESQRFFLDIALRMALVRYISDAQGNSATIYVDTPEGSLDIAYESRAGELFAAYATAGRRLVMTSNINSSKLLLKLAEVCGRSRLQLEPMTDWSTLSQVQIEEADLFTSALDAVRTAMDDHR